LPVCFLFFMLPRPPTSTLFPYTTLFRSLAGAIAFQGFVVTGFNFIVNLWLLKHYRPSALSALFLTQPIFGVVAAAIVWGEPHTDDVVVATLAVIVGIALTQR